MCRCKLAQNHGKRDHLPSATCHWRWDDSGDAAIMRSPKEQGLVPFMQGRCHASPCCPSWHILRIVSLWMTPQGCLDPMNSLNYDVVPCCKAFGLPCCNALSAADYVLTCSIMPVGLPDLEVTHKLCCSSITTQDEVKPRKPARQGQAAVRLPRPSLSHLLTMRFSNTTKVLAKCVQNATLLLQLVFIADDRSGLGTAFSAEGRGQDQKPLTAITGTTNVLRLHHHLQAISKRNMPMMELLAVEELGFDFAPPSGSVNGSPRTVCVWRWAS